jgi:hypothetical protein
VHGGGNTPGSMTGNEANVKKVTSLQAMCNE